MVKKFNLNRRHCTGIKSFQEIRLSSDKLKLFDLFNAFQLEVRKILFTKFYPLFNQIEGYVIFIFEKDPFSVSLHRGPRLLQFSHII